jgi:hypothetical protein
VPFGNGFAVRSTGHFGPKVPMNHTPQRSVTSESTKEAVQTAGNGLQQMRINNFQKFDSLLNDFEFKLALFKKAR